MIGVDYKQASEPREQLIKKILDISVKACFVV